MDAQLLTCGCVANSFQVGHSAPDAAVSSDHTSDFSNSPEDKEKGITMTLPHDN